MKKLISIIALTFLSQSAFATDDGVAEFKGGKPNPSFELKSKVQLSHKALALTSDEVYEKTKAVWDYFQVASEESNSDLMSVYDGKQSLKNIARILSIMDNKKQFQRFADTETNELKFFFDRDSKIDLDVNLQLTNQPNFESQAIQRLKAAKANSSQMPLKGIKIALDPGHMSTKDWDNRTGKFVHDKKGNIISEGLINLQTCLVLKAELEKLGAIVMVTRENHNPITTTSLQDLDIQDYGRKYLKNNSLSPWFLNILASAPIGPNLFKNFETSADFQKLFKESARENYFIKGADLQARVDKIEEFNPDISLIIHYDSQDPANDPNGVNTKNYSRVKTYVHGSIDPEEWSGAKERSYVLHHLLDSNSYDFSKLLAEEVVNGLKNGLKLGYDVTGGGSSYLVSPGVFARNLFITKKLHGHAHAYVECLHYNDPTEFKAMLKKEYTLKIDGKQTYYSKRLRDVALSIRNGVLNFMTKI